MMHLSERTTRAILLFGKVLVSLAVVVAAVVAAWYIWVYYERDPRTREGHVRADTVGVTADVSGLITYVAVSGDQRVRKGELLYRVDPARFRIALDRARANLESAEASLIFARQQAHRNRALAGLVSQQTIDQSDSELRTAKATVDQDRALLASAQLDLKRSSVRAPVNGIVAYANLRPGAYVTPGHGLVTMIDEDSLRVEGYFQETRIGLIKVGDPADVILMGQQQVLHGHVSSITGAINDSDTSIGSNLLPTINPNFSWVRLAQRIPVRVRLDEVPAGTVLIPGRSATVVIEGKPHYPSRAALFPVPAENSSGPMIPAQDALIPNAREAAAPATTGSAQGEWP